MTALSAERMLTRKSVNLFSAIFFLFLLDYSKVTMPRVLKYVTFSRRKKTTSEDIAVRNKLQVSVFLEIIVLSKP